MRLGIAIPAVLALIVSAYAVVALVSPRQMSAIQAKPANEAAKKEGPQRAPAISPTGPYPKAVVDKTDYDFGRMEVGEEKSFAYTIRNEGEAPLIIVKGPTTCQCTVSDVEAGELAPGHSAKVTLTWKPHTQAEQFGKGADILTNDPENTVIHLRILGMVAARLVTSPVRNWISPDVYDDKPTVLSGAIYSPVVRKFNVVAVEIKDPAMTADVVPMDKEQLKANKALCGYEIRVSLTSGMPVGAFLYPLTIKTDLPQRNAEGKLGEPFDVEVLVSGHRRGPLHFIGREWIEEKMVIAMGPFDSAVGKTVTLPMFVRGASADFKLTEPPACEPEGLKVNLVRDEKSKGSHTRFLLSVEYPAGSPRVSYREDKPAKIRLRTNYPGAEDIELSVYLTAF